MVISAKPIDFAGNQMVHDGVTLAWDAMTNTSIPAATQPSICAGTGDPTFSAKKGTLYIRLDGSGATNRLWINHNGTTGWHHIPAAG